MSKEAPALLRHLKEVNLEQQTFEVEEAGKVKGETKPRRTARLSGELVSHLWDDANTLYHAFERSRRLYPKNSCLASRSFNERKLGAYKWENYAQVGSRVDHFGAGLAGLGMKSGDALGIWAENSAEWLICALAAWSQSFAVVPIFPACGQEYATYVINHAKVRHLVCSADALRTLSQVTDKCKKLRHVISLARDRPHPKRFTDDEVEMDEVNDLGDTPLHSFAEIEEEGRTGSGASAPDSSSMALIAYTAGAAGPPKGVVHSHGSLLAAQAGLLPVLAGVKPSDVFYSFMPLAHTFELVCATTMLASGAGVGTCSGDPSDMVADVEKLKPTIISGVPGIYQRMYTKLIQRVSHTSAVKRWLFRKGYTTKQENQDNGGGSFLWNTLVFNNFKARMGGRVRLLLTSGAAIGASTCEFLKIVFCCAVVQVYTSTEAGGLISATHPSDPDIRHVGSPVASLEIKLVDVPSLGFTSKNDPPSGEVCIRGPCVATGFYKDDQLSGTVFEDDGWCHTGDIGQWNSNGTLTLVDRQENIYALSTGNFVAAERLETIYSRSQFVSQILVHGDSTEPCLVAAVMVNPSVVSSFAANRTIRHQFDGESNAANLCMHEKMRNVVVSDLRSLAKSNDLKSSDLVRAVHLDIGGWSVDEGLVTPTGRIVRAKLTKKYRKQLTDLYSELKQQARAALDQKDQGSSSGRRDNDSDDAGSTSDESSDE